jgi:hypothetical protein
MGSAYSSEPEPSKPECGAIQFSLYLAIAVALTIALVTTVLIPVPAGADEDKWNDAYGNETPAWTPPPVPSDADISVVEYTQMWAGMKTLPGDAGDALASANGSYSQNAAAYAIAAQEDPVTATPPDQPDEWNTAIDDKFDGSGLQTSSYPPGTNTRNGTYVKDAYIRIAEPTPSTRLHTGNGQVHLVKSDGKILLANDFRIETPVDDSPSGVRKSFELAEVTQSDVLITADGTNITEETTDASGAVTVRYAGIATDQTDLTVKKEFSATYEVTTERYLCDDENCTSRSWRVTDVSEQSDSVTVTDTISVERESDHGEIDVRPSEENDHVRIHAPEYWSALELGQGQSVFVSSEIAFFTTRNRAWDTFVDATSDGVSEPYAHDFTPVQTHATPAYRGVFNVEAGAPGLRVETITQDLGSETSYPDQPQNVNISTTTGYDTYRPVETATVRVSGLDAPPNPDTSLGNEPNAEYHPLVAGNTIATSQERWEPTRDANLTVDVEPMYANENSEEPTHYRVTVDLRDAETGEAIRTQGTDRKILLNDRYELNTDGTGRALRTFDAEERAPTGFNAKFVPRDPFAGDVYYAPAEDSSSTPVQYTGLAAAVQDILAVVVPMLLKIVFPFVMLWVIASIGLYGKIPYLGRI